MPALPVLQPPLRRIAAASGLYCSLILLLFLAPARAQESPRTIKVFTNIPGVAFYVDGHLYRDTAIFTWYAGTKHVLSTVPFDDILRPRTLYTFAGWVPEGGVITGAAATTVTVEMQPSLTAVHAQFTTQYKFALRYFKCTGGVCGAPGAIGIEGDFPGAGTYNSDMEAWVTEGTVLTLHPEPASNWAFAGWTPGPDISVQGTIATVVVDEPVTVYPRFAIARHVKLLSEPSGMRLLADYTNVVTPATLDWGWNTAHPLAPLTPQSDAAGRLWVFQAWSDGGDPVRIYQVQPGGYQDTLTARFVRGVPASFTTTPARLKLLIDGRDNQYTYNFTWGVGETHHVEAPASQTDDQGRVYVFRGWSNGSPSPAQDFIVGDAQLAAGIRLAAVYELLGRLVLQTNLAGAAVAVDGVDCALPCTLDRPVGATVQLAAQAAIPAGDNTRYDFRGWSDGGANPRAFTFTADNKVLSLNYALLYHLSVVPDPAGGAQWTTAPVSADGFFENGTNAILTVTPVSGFRFLRLEGDATGALTSVFVKMTGPKVVRVVLEKIATAPLTNVRNAAAETPDDVVAPGSVVSIVGTNLAPSAEVGSENPPTQTLAGITVWLGDYLLPLLYASPTQIYAALPYGMEPGAQTLVIKWPGKPDVRADFNAARNAPGLFQFALGDQTYAIALHEDGSLITPDAPARRGDTVLLFGTGFGPYDRQPAEGFPIPESPLYTLVDTVEVSSADIPLETLWAGAAAGRAGIQNVRVRLPQDLPDAAAIPIDVRINGRQSNTVLLPLE